MCVKLKPGSALCCIMMRLCLTINHDGATRTPSLKPQRLWLQLCLSKLATQDDAASSLAHQNDYFDPSGILFLGKGQYNVNTDLKLTKTIYAEDGAVFVVAQGGSGWLPRISACKL